MIRSRLIPLGAAAILALGIGSGAVPAFAASGDTTGGAAMESGQTAPGATAPAKPSTGKHHSSSDKQSSKSSQHSSKHASNTSKKAKPASSEKM